MWSRESESIHIRRNLLEALSPACHSLPGARWAAGLLVMGSPQPPECSTGTNLTIWRKVVHPKARGSATLLCPDPGPASVSSVKNTYLSYGRGTQGPVPTSQFCLRSFTVLGGWGTPKNGGWRAVAAPPGVPLSVLSVSSAFSSPSSRSGGVGAH